jgi:hypothetical protein
MVRTGRMRKVWISSPVSALIALKSYAWPEAPSPVSGVIET